MALGKVLHPFIYFCLLISAQAGAQVTPKPPIPPLVVPGVKVFPEMDSLPGSKVVREMHDRYAGKWFKTLTFVQTTTQQLPDGSTRTTTWYESLALPGTLRIDIGSPDEGNGVLYTADSVYRLRRGKVVLAAAERNELLPLAFDVYVVPVARTLASLRAIGFDLSTVRPDTFQGRPALVVGAQAGDLTSPQFWVDKERLVVVRQIQRVGTGNTGLVDIQFSQYRQIDKSWIAPVVRIYINGALAQHEIYSNIKADVALPKQLFDVTAWTSGEHWARALAASPQPLPPASPPPAPER